MIESASEKTIPLSQERIARQINMLLGTSDTSENSDRTAELTIIKLTPGERAQELYQYLQEYRHYLKNARKTTESKPKKEKGQLRKLFARFSKQQDAITETTVSSFNQNLLKRMRGLWNDQATRAVFLKKYEQANIDFVSAQSSPFLDQAKNLEKQRINRVTRYKQLSEVLFTSNPSPSDLMELEAEVRDVVWLLTHSETEIANLRNSVLEDKSKKSCDALAMLEAQKIIEIRHNLDTKNFHWFPSFTTYFHEALLAIRTGRWPLFIGEAGTGKSILAIATAEALTGSKPTLVACTSRTGEEHLIAQVAMKGDQTYAQYEAAMRAATGKSNSLTETPQESTQGRIFRLDELFKLGNDSPAFAYLKELAGLKPGDTYRREEVLKGFAGIATTNPAGNRYDNGEPNPALIREFSQITVDYPQMSSENKELFYFMLACLIDQNGIMLGVDRSEVAPYFSLSVENQQYELSPQETDLRHGYLYRLAFAVRAVQDAFIIHNNEAQVKPTALKRSNAEGINQNEGALLQLTHSTITPGDVRSWLENFSKRRQVHHPIGQTDSLENYLIAQLQTYIKQADESDKQTLIDIFTYYGVLESSQTKKIFEPMTLKDLGYLSPEIPRPSLKEIKEYLDTSLHGDTRVMLTDEHSINIKQAKATFLFNNEGRYQEKTIQPRTPVIIDGINYFYAGIPTEDDAQHPTVVLMIADKDNIHVRLTQEEFGRKAQLVDEEFRKKFKKENYFGPEELNNALERLCSLKGIQAKFDFSETAVHQQLLEMMKFLEKADTAGEFICTIMPNQIWYKKNNGEIYHGPITTKVLSELIERKYIREPILGNRKIVNITYNDPEINPFPDLNPHLTIAGDQHFFNQEAIEPGIHLFSKQQISKTNLKNTENLSGLTVPTASELLFQMLFTNTIFPGSLLNSNSHNNNGNPISVELKANNESIWMHAGIPKAQEAQFLLQKIPKS